VRPVRISSGLKWGKFGTFFACSAYDKKDPSSCTFTKENTAAKPDMNTPEAQEAGETEEYCENCGGDGAAAWAFRHVHELPRVQRRSALQDDPQVEPEAAAEASGAYRRRVPGVRQAAGAAAGTVWGVCFLFRISEVQVREAEPD